MKTYSELIQDILCEEAEIVFPFLTNEMCLELGLTLVKQCRERNCNMVIEITKCGQLVFHYACDGTAPDNAKWINGKIRTVERFGHSSFYYNCYLKEIGKSMEERFLVDGKEYRAYGGAFPLNVRNIGQVGIVGVSGLSQDQDHAFVVDGLKRYLSEFKEKQ